MAMAACGEDEFGSLFADSLVEDVRALRGFGSVHWLVEDETDTSSDALSRKMAPYEHLPGATVDGCYASLSPAQAELDASAILCTSTKDYQEDSKNNLTDGISDAKGIGVPSKGAETDSDDDLHIVLNPSQKMVGEGSAEDSEDGEDFVVLTSHEVAGGQEDSFMPVEQSAQANLVGVEKLGTPTDEKAQSGKTPGVHSRIGYDSQAYHRHFKVKSQLDLMRAEFYLL